MNNNILSPNLPEPTGKRIVIVGGGFAGIEFAKKINHPEYQIVLLDKNNYHQFQPLFYQVATAGIEPSAISYPFRKLFQNKRNFHFRLAEVIEIKPEDKLLNTTIGLVSYDILILAMGAKTNYYGNKDLEKYTYPLKSISDSLSFRNSILHKFEQALLKANHEDVQQLLQFVVVGGGPTGVEVSGALSEMKKFILPKDYPELDFNLMKIYLIEGSDRLLNAMTLFSSEHAKHYLRSMGVDVILNKSVKSYNGRTLVLSDHTKIEADTVIWAAGIKGAGVIGLNENIYLPNQRLQVDEYNRVKGYEDIFALGDLAAHETASPQVAQGAIQQGLLLARNLNHGIDPSKWKSYKYFDKGSMATVGRNKAVAEIVGLKFSGFMAWFVWMFIHLMSILGFKNKIQTLINWAWSYFSYDQSLRLMIQANKTLPDLPEDNNPSNIQNKPEPNSSNKKLEMVK
ncbi:MAG: NAD(P)/FAD-dependent oxidoreductase [Saprospiraceae bacterium]